MSPFASVVIVNHNGIDFIDACLRSVLNNDYHDFELIFVDNGSTDGSLEYVKTKFGSDLRLHFIENKASLGPAVGRNRGIAISKGRYIAFLDNDTEVDSSWLTELIKVLEQDPSIGAAQSKILRLEPKDTFDCAGDFLNSLGFLTERARAAKDIGQFDYLCDIFSAKSAASIVRKEVLEKIGGFDEDYYMYLEETDLSWRIWLAGYRIVFVPTSIVWHAYGTKKKTKQQYYSDYIVRYCGSRNYITTLIKNLCFTSLIRILPLHIISWFGLSVMFMFKKKIRDSFWIIKAIIWNIFHLPLVLKKRNFIQKNIRKVEDCQIFKKIMVSNPPSYYIGKALSYIYGKPF